MLILNGWDETPALSLTFATLADPTTKRYTTAIPESVFQDLLEDMID